jgi:hypothetical protein
MNDPSLPDRCGQVSGASGASGGRGGGGVRGGVGCGGVRGRSSQDFGLGAKVVGVRIVHPVPGGLVQGWGAGSGALGSRVIQV